MTLRKSTILAARLVVVAVLLATVGSCSGDEGGKSVPRMQAVLDYSPTLSDADALLYLASNPAVDLLAVTLPGTGEADCGPGVQITRALLTVAGKPDVPIGCGRNTPLFGDRDWPEEWRAASNSLGDGLLPTVAAEPVVDAEQLLADTLRAAESPVTLVAVGPLTNLGVVLGDHPELAKHVARIVIMGGAVNVPGNVEASPAAEWNLYIDPEAARRVIAAGIALTFVPLDATNYLAWTDRLVLRLNALDSDSAQTVHDLARARGSLDGFYLWDELAAMVAVEPSLATTESMTMTVDDDGVLVRDPTGHTVDVAVSADTPAATDEFIRGLNRGNLPTEVQLTAVELDYMVAMGGADSRFGIAVGHAYEGVDESDPDIHGMAASVVTGFLDAVDGLVVAMRDISPPPSLRAVHDDYLDSLTSFVANRDDFLAAVTAAEGSDLNELFDHALADSGVDDLFERINVACQTLVTYSFLRDGPRPCSPGG